MKRTAAVSTSLRVFGIFLAATALGTLGGCPGSTTTDTTLDGTWTVTLQSQGTGTTIASFSLTIENGDPSSLSMPSLPAPLNDLAISLNGRTFGLAGVATIKGTGSMTHDGDFVTIVMTLQATVVGETANGTLTLEGTAANGEITGTATLTGSVPGVTIPSGGATADFTMTQ